ncbi:MAG: DUF378 domain-containing protein [Tenericutes bacterium]|nr:DUF378 domain-containing protein [Mycoplasmatota bacterium]
MEALQKITLIFTIIGGILWGIIGLFNYNPLESLFNNMLIIPRIIYIIVGICALVNIGLLFDHIEK